MTCIEAIYLVRSTEIVKKTHEKHSMQRTAIIMSSTNLGSLEKGQKCFVVNSAVCHIFEVIFPVVVCSFILPVNSDRVC